MCLRRARPTAHKHYAHDSKCTVIFKRVYYDPTPLWQSTSTPVQGLSVSWFVECISVHAIKFTALNIKHETAHKKVEPPINPEKTQSIPSSLALQPSPIRGE